MIVGVDVLVFAFPVAKGLECEIRDHLVGVHIGRGSRTALDEIGHELITELACDEPIAGLHDGVGHPGVERAQVTVGHSGRLLHVGESTHETRLLRHRNTGDAEVFLGTQRLHAVVRAVRKLLFAEKISLDTGHRCHLILLKIPTCQQAGQRTPESTAHLTTPGLRAAGRANPRCSRYRPAGYRPARGRNLPPLH